MKCMSVGAGLLALSSLVACDDGDTGCTEHYVTFPVVVFDDGGGRLANVEVTATNLESGKVITARTDDNGETLAIGENVGGGAVRIVAQHEGLSAGVDTLWTCDACHCTPSQPSATFILRPVVPCTLDILKLLISVVDSEGNQVGNATVTATHLEDARVLEVSAESGYHWILETQFVRRVGEAGTTRVVAELGERKVERDVDWTCDACHCFPESMEVTLTLPD